MQKTVKYLIILAMCGFSHCYSYFVVNTEYCGFDSDCGDTCYSESGVFYLKGQQPEPIIATSANKGASSCGLGLGGPCFLPFIPYPRAFGYPTTIGLTALSGNTADPVADIRFSGVDNDLKRSRYNAPDVPPFSLIPGSSSKSSPSTTDYTSFEIPQGKLIAERIEIIRESGASQTVEDFSLSTNQAFGFAIVLHHNITTGKILLGYEKDPYCDR